MQTSLPPHLAHFPQPDVGAIAHSNRLCTLIAEEIGDCGGWISFARYMELALHAPGLGYYSAGATKFGAAGDFVTAPGMGNLFARTLARQAAQLVRAGLTTLLELGAGDGRLAVDLLLELEALDALPDSYWILETSGELRQRQQQLINDRLPHLASRVKWLTAMSDMRNVLIIANEVLDAMPVHLVTTSDKTLLERGVAVSNGEFVWEARPASQQLLSAAVGLELASGYTTEIHIAAQAFVRMLAANLKRGVALFVDYGFPAREYYHPQRTNGTLMCHYRHHAHDHPLCLTGLQDITSHVDFSAIARIAGEAGMDVSGYAHQAQFLINCGITDVLAATPPTDPAYLRIAAEAQRLLSPAEMGELFKVLAIARDVDTPLVGFSQGNRAATLV